MVRQYRTKRGSPGGGSKKPPLTERGVTPKEAAAAYDRAAKFNQPQPDDLVHDPRYGMKVSRFGQDRGAIVRDCDEGEIVDPANHEERIAVRRVRSGLVRLYREGAISEEMLRAGKFFQDRFEAAGYVHYSTIDFNRVGGGNGGRVEERLCAATQDRKIVDKLLKAVGFPYSQMGKASWWIIGHGMGLEEIAVRYDLHDFTGAKDRRYWKAMVVAALEVMSKIILQSRAGRKSGKIEVLRRFTDDEMTVMGRPVDRG